MPYALRRCADLLASSTVAQADHWLPSRAMLRTPNAPRPARPSRDGGQELDMVINISKALSGDWTYVRNDIEAKYSTSPMGRSAS